MKKVSEVEKEESEWESRSHVPSCLPSLGKTWLGSTRACSLRLNPRHTPNLASRCSQTPPIRSDHS